MFRKIDIDKYDEDVLRGEELYDADPRDPGQILEEARQRQAAVRGSLAKFVFLQPHAMILRTECDSNYYSPTEMILLVHSQSF